MVKLTVDNLSSWRRRIPTEILPQTSLDALQAAKRLGIDYFWIDSLCIIQEEDQHKDWKQAQRCKIYIRMYISTFALHGALT